jgi:serine/threonine protein phosphatase 1
MRSLPFFTRTFQDTAIVRPRVDHRERVYAVGDVHGRVDLLNALLDDIREDMETQDDGRSARIVLLGDYIDRGDSSRQVLECLRNLSREVFPCDCLMGNHEAAMIDFLDDPRRGETWTKMGGLQTLASFGVQVPVRTLTQDDLTRIRDDFHEAVSPLLPFFSAMPMIVTSGDVVFCHAGVNPAQDLDAQTTRALLWGHPDALGDEPLPGKLVVHGHYDAPEIVSRRGRICLDTGAYYSGALTAVRFDVGEYVMRAGR